MVVDVVDEGVERPHALLEAARDLVPFALQDEAGHDVERPFAVDVRTVVVDGERDAHGTDGEFGSRLAFADLVVGQFRQRLQQAARARPRLAGGGDEFVPEIVGAVGLPVDCHRVDQAGERTWERGHDHEVDVWPRRRSIASATPGFSWWQGPTRPH